jgi:hypothetical protein
MFVKIRRPADRNMKNGRIERAREDTVPDRTPIVFSHWQANAATTAPVADAVLPELDPLSISIVLSAVRYEMTGNKTAVRGENESVAPLRPITIPYAYVNGIPSGEELSYMENA